MGGVSKSVDGTNRDYQWLVDNDEDLVKENTDFERVTSEKLVWHSNFTSTQMYFLINKSACWYGSSFQDTSVADQCMKCNLHHFSFRIIIYCYVHSLFHRL